MKKLLFFLLFVFLSGNRSLPAQIKTAIQQKVARGDSLRKSGNFKKAKKNYENILKLDKNCLPAYTGLGKIFIARNNWKKAAKFFNKITTIQPDNPEANYYRGITYREKGKYKALLLRKLDWDKSKKAFEKVISRDSLYRDVLYQYAILKRYRHKYRKAITLGERQIALQPLQPATQSGLFKLYRYFIHHTGQNKAVQWLREQNLQLALFFIAEKYRWDGDSLKAKQLLSALFPGRAPLLRIPVRLSLARIFYRQDKPDSGEFYYRDALDRIKNKYDADIIFEDLKYIITDREYEVYRQLNKPVDWKQFFKKFWLIRNPMPASRINERLTGHYQRLLYAEKYFGYDGFRTWFNNPDKLHYLNYPKSYALNREFNDKGLIYIRQGKADNWVATLGENVPMNESWQYYRTQVNPEMTFHFLKSNAAANNWRLAPYISNPEMLADRVELGNEYFQMLTASPLDRPRIIDEMAEESKKSVTTALTTDRHTWSKGIKPLNLSFSIVTFRGKNGKTDTEFYYAIPVKQLMPETADSVQTIDLESGITFHDLEWHQIIKQTGNLKLPKPDSANGAWIDVYRFYVAPDSYHVAFHARPRRSHLLGGAKFDENIDNYNSDKLNISDLLFAENITPDRGKSKFIKHGLRISPNPSHQFHRKKPIFLYYEIYRLTPDTNRRTSFTTEYTLKLTGGKQRNLKNLFGLLKGKMRSSVSIQSDREGETEFSAEYISIDVSRLAAGEYRLSVKVSDKNSSQYATKTDKLFLLK